MTQICGTLRCGLCVLLIGAPIYAQPDCLFDADGDGHPLFGSTYSRPDIERFEDRLYIGRPTSVDFGDLDGDGDLDAVFAQCQQGRFIHEVSYLTVLMGSGDGVFGPPTMYRAGQEPVTVKLADFNGDGSLDIAVTNASEDTVSILFGRGDGTFDPDTKYNVGDEPRPLLAADFDADGDVDLAVVNLLDRTLSILLNTGDGSFEVHAPLDLGSITQRGDGNRTFPYPGPHMATADLDGDGDLDLAIPAGSRMKILFNDGAGVFTLAAEHPSAAVSDVYAIIAEDLDGDGDIDLASANTGNAARGVSVNMNLGDGRFGPPRAYAVHNWGDPDAFYFNNGLAAADLDHDGDIDLAVAQENLPRFTILRNNGDGTYGPQEIHEVVRGPWFVMLKDVNADGWADFIALTFAIRAGMRIQLNDGAGNLLSARREPPSEFPRRSTDQKSILASDLDRDGDLDFVVTMTNRENATGQVRLVENIGAGHFEDRGTILLAPLTESVGMHAAAGDLTGDGLLDLVVADTVVPGGFVDPGTLWVLVNQGGMNFAEPVAYPLADAYPQSVRLGDLDGDGDLDVVAWLSGVYPGNLKIPVDLRIWILLNTGDGTLIPDAQYVFTDAPWFPLGDASIGDVDGDGDLDIAAVGGPRVEPGTLAILLNDGNASFHISEQHTIAPQARSLIVEDLNNDGDADIAIVYNHNFLLEEVAFEPYLTVLANDGHGNFTVVQEFVDPNAIPDSLMNAADFDADGDLDLAFVEISGHVTIQLNNGDGSFGAPVRYNDFERSRDLAVGDFDQDGRIDIATANGRHGEVLILTNLGCNRICRADFNDDGIVNTFDVIAYLRAYNAADPRADMNGDGIVNTLDFLVFLNAYNEGC